MQLFCAADAVIANLHMLSTLLASEARSMYGSPGWDRVIALYLTAQQANGYDTTVCCCSVARRSREAGQVTMSVSSRRHAREQDIIPCTEAEGIQGSCN